MRPLSSHSTLPLTSVLFAIFVTTVWGLNFIMIKTSLMELPPLTLCAIRFFLASIPAVFFISRPRLPLKTLLLYGICTFSLQFGLLFAGIASGVSASIAALIVQSQVFFTVLFASMAAKQSVNTWQILGGIVSFLGISVLALHKGEMECNFLSVILLLLSASCWALGNVVVILAPKVHMFSLIIWGNFVAFFPTFLVALCFENPLPIFLLQTPLHTHTLLSIAYIVLISTYLGYYGWSWLLSKHPAASITPFALLCPIVALFASSWIFKETLTSWKILSTLLVLLGLAINLFGPRIKASLVRTRVESA